MKIHIAPQEYKGAVSNQSGEITEFEVYKKLQSLCESQPDVLVLHTMIVSPAKLKAVFGEYPKMLSTGIQRQMEAGM